MLIEFQPGAPMTHPGIIELQGGEDEKDRLLARAQELFPKTELHYKSGKEWACVSLPQSREFWPLYNKLAERTGNLSEGLKAQSYALHARDKDFCVAALGPAGLFYGMSALSEFFERKGSSAEAVETPRFERRGFLQDLSRGQVLNFFGFERLIRGLAACRYNFLTFNLEHNFAYQKHPLIPGGDDALSAEEARALARLCREFYIEVVPMQQSLGHCRGILSREKYRGLAFDQNLLWSLDPRNQEIYALLAELYQEQHECFPGKYFLTGCDEPFDLKKFWKPENAGGKTFPQIYLEHLHKLNKIVSGLGRRMMVWGDVFVSHPELLAELPEDVIIINWQYGTSRLEGENFYEDKSKAIAASGREFYVATTTWSYARLVPELKTMEANNKNFLNAGSRLGAAGALCANWGDLGHLQLLGQVALPLGYFGLHSWKASSQTLEEFAKDFSAYFFGDDAGKTGEFYLMLEKINDLITPGPAFGAAALFVLLDDLFSDQFLPDRPVAQVNDDLLKVLKQTSAVTADLTGIKNYEWVLDQKPVIYALGILFTKLLLKDTAPIALSDPSKIEDIIGLFGHLKNYVDNFGASLKDRWLCQAKPAGLSKILARVAKTSEGHEKRMKQLAEAKDSSFEKLRDAPEFQEYKFNLLKELGLEGLL